MWNSVLLDGVKWSFDRSSPPLMDDNNHTEDDETQFRSWDFKSHQQTNYADWTNKQDGQDDDAEDLFLRHNSVDRRTNSYPSAAELFRNFVGKLSVWDKVATKRKDRHVVDDSFNDPH